MDGSGWRPGGGACGGLPAPLERQELGPPGRGPISLEKWGKEHQGLCPDPVGKGFSPLSLDCCRSGIGFSVGLPACGLQTNASWPAHSSGGREKWFVDGRKAGNQTVALPSPKRVPPTSPAPPSRWAGRYRAFQCEGRRPGIPVRSTASHTTPPEGGPGRNLLPGGSFPHFFPRNGAPAGQAPFPPVPTAWGSPPKERCPARPHANRGRPALKKPAASGTTPPRHAPRRTPPR